MNDTRDLQPKPGLRLRGLQLRSWLGILALVLQLVLPAVHSIEIRRELDAAPGVAAPSEAGRIALLAAPAPPRHDPSRCPICSDLAHLQSLTQEEVQIAIPVPLELPLVVAFEPVPPRVESAHPDARAPPSSLLS
jgi:hypothetical protein